MNIANHKEISNFIKEHSDIPQVPVKDITLLYGEDWYDGPLSGMCLWNGLRLFYQIDPESLSEPDQTYALIRLNSEQQQSEDYFHRLFVENVSDHFVFVPDPEIQVKENNNNKVYYEEAARKPKFNILREQVVGYFLNRHRPIDAPR